VELDSRAFGELAMSFGGSRIRPGDTAYDEQGGFGTPRSTGARL
jgi:hypothetical protein